MTQSLRRVLMSGAGIGRLRHLEPDESHDELFFF